MVNGETNAAGTTLDEPMSRARRLSAASITANMSSAVASTVGGVPTRSESPTPRRSKKIKRPIRETAAIHSRQRRPPDALNMRNEAWNKHDVERTAANNLKGQMDAACFHITGSGHVRVSNPIPLLQQSDSGRVWQHAEFVAQGSGAGFELMFGCRPVPSSQVRSDQMPMRALA